MNIFSKAYQKIEGFVLRNASYLALKTALGTSPRSSAPSTTLQYRAKMLRVQTLQSWKSAVMLATDPENPDKARLRELYDNLEQDNHLGSVVESRIAKTQQSPFRVVNEHGERDDEAKKLFETVWFQDFVKYVLMSKFQGTTLLELIKTDGEGRLTEVTEIPQGHFNALKGIILKEVGDTTGTSYKDGKLSNYYIQIGKDYNDLGLYTLVAPIVLAKKLGLGSWLDYIEKYGVPPLFITTDRDDQTHIDQLREAAENFKASPFMIGVGADKFEIPNLTGGNNGEGVFDSLIKRADNEISKRFLGGTGLTDEKGFVGSVEVQFELASFRFESDKILVKHYINTYLIPLLLKLSPLYAPLASLRFEWDDEEPMTTEKLCNIVQTLGAHYDFDPEQVEAITGLKIVGIKDTTPTLTAIGNEKKKP